MSSPSASTTRSTPDRYRRLPKDAYDAVIVGAGTGGLTAAALLASRGASVLVLDQHYVAGGNATVFKRPGYEFDIGLHYIGDCGAGGGIPRVLHAVGIEDVTFLEMDPDGFETYCFPDFRFRVPRGLEPFRRRLLECFPEEAVAIDRYLRLLQEVESLGLHVRPLGGLHGLQRAPLVARFATATMAEFLDTCTHNNKLRAVIAGQQSNYGEPPSRFALLAHAVMVVHYNLRGAYYPKGGGQVISDRLARAIEERGGKILLSARVNRILIEDRRVVGVELESRHCGTRVVKAPIVISNADLKKTLLQLVGPEHLPEATVTRTREFEMSAALGVVYAGLRRDLRAEGVPNTNFLVYASYDLEGFYAEARAGRFHPEPACYVSLASLKDPDNPRIAPRGISNVQLIAVVPSQPEAWGTSWDETRSGAYRKNPVYRRRKEEFARSMLDLAARAIPGLRSALVFHEVATPLSHSRYTGSSGGTSYGIALTPAQFLHRRPGPRTDVPGLYVCGASGLTGHGIHGTMMSGLLAASQVLGAQLVDDILGPAPA